MRPKLVPARASSENWKLMIREKFLVALTGIERV
jgi:hypothetical protein